MQREPALHALSFAVIGSVLAEWPTLTIAGAAMLGVAKRRTVPAVLEVARFYRQATDRSEDGLRECVRRPKTRTPGYEGGGVCLQTVHFRVTFGNERTYTS